MMRKKVISDKKGLCLVIAMAMALIGLFAALMTVTTVAPSAVQADEAAPAYIAPEVTARFIFTITFEGDEIGYKVSNNGTMAHFTNKDLQTVLDHALNWVVTDAEFKGNMRFTFSGISTSKTLVLSGENYTPKSEADAENLNIVLTGSLELIADGPSATLISIEGNANVHSKANIEYTYLEGSVTVNTVDAAIGVGAGSTLHIVEGAVSGNFTAILGAGGAVNIWGGTVSAVMAGAQDGSAICNNGTGAVNVIGGEVSATGSSGVAIQNRSAGKITIGGGEGTATVTSANNNAELGTVCIKGTDAEQTVLLEVKTGADIKNSFEGANARAINNDTLGNVVVSGGKVSVTGGYAIENRSEGAVNVIGGEVSAAGDSGLAIYNSSTGKITIGGGEGTATVTSANTNAELGTVYLQEGSATDTVLEVKSGADIKNSVNGANARAINNNANTSGRIVMSGGKVSATTGVAINNNSAGAVNISGGKVSATSGVAINNNSAGVVNISGGEVAATTGKAISNTSNSTGKITIGGGEGTATVTSAVTTGSSGTIYLLGGSAENTVLKVESGAVIKNTGEGPGCKAIRNNGVGDIVIEGGEVSAKTGMAIYNNSTGKITIGGGEGTATVTSASASDTSGTVYLAGGSAENTVLKVESGAVIKNTEETEETIVCKTIYNNGRGNIVIEGGEVSAVSTKGIAIYNFFTGNVNIGGGKVSASGANGAAIFNNTTGVVNISGGEVSATGTSGAAIFNNSTSAVNVSGGTVSVTTGTAIYNNSKGAVTISQADADTPTRVEATEDDGIVVVINAGNGQNAVLTLHGAYLYHASENATNDRYIKNDVTGKVVVVSEFEESDDVSKGYDGTGEISCIGGAGWNDVTYTWERENAQGGWDKVTGEEDDTLLRVNVDDSDDYRAVVVFGAYGYTAEYTSEAIQVDITAKQLSMEEGTAAVDRAYDGTMSVALTKGLAGVVSGEDVSFTATVESADASNAKAVSITLVGSDIENYVIGSVSLTVNITKLTLTITPNAQSIAYGAAVSQDGYTVTGFLDGEDASVISGNVVLSASGTKGGTHTITADVSGLSATNYTFAVGNSAALTITVKLTAAGEGVDAALFVGYVAGDALPVPEREGYTFKGWYASADLSGDPVTVMDADGTLYAAWEKDADVTEEGKDGLSGGAIAGIVIGSILAAAIVGFAIFWFAIKKKTFADLIKMFKKAPKATPEAKKPEEVASEEAIENTSEETAEETSDEITDEAAGEITDEISGDTSEE